VPQKYFTIDGIATFVHHTGPTTLPEVVPDLSRGESLLCLHGAGGNGAVFNGFMESLSDAHSPLAFDQPGHGRSGSLDSLGSVPRMSAFTGALQAKLGIERAVLLGHSMGGAVALQRALDEPGSVRALVLVGSGAHFSIPDEFVEFTRRITEGKERRQFQREAYSPATPPEIMRRGFMEDMKTDPRATYGDVLAVREFDVTQRLADIAAPTLVIVGDSEMDFMREQADQLAERIPNARRIEIAKAGHMLPLEQPEAMAEAVASFLGEL
jgi:pimeloyl-ACP methyl ester carboxylesterase